MECNNKHCYWSSFGCCCHESEEGYINATPNQLDCPSVLRADFESLFWAVRDECIGLIDERNCKELLEIHSFITKQRHKK